MAVRHSQGNPRYSGPEKGEKSAPSTRSLFICPSSPTAFDSIIAAHWVWPLIVLQVKARWRSREVLASLANWTSGCRRSAILRRAARFVSRAMGSVDRHYLAVLVQHWQRQQRSCGSAASDSILRTIKQSAARCVVLSWATHCSRRALVTEPCISPISAVNHLHTYLPT